MRSEHLILVVDDTPDTIRLISGILTPHYRVRVATGGERGLELAAEAAGPDLILLDVVMPDVDGYETCRRLKENPKTASIPVIFLTAKSDEEDERKGLSLGAVDYITKPISPSILLARVRTQLRLKEATDLLRESNQALEQRVAERTRELLETNEALARFVPDAFLREIGRANIRDVRQGDHVHREMTVMFCDVRSYTTIAESMSPQEAFRFLNQHLSSVAPVIGSHRGLISQFYGDGVMAIFPHSPADAVRAAVDMHRVVEQTNRVRREEGNQAIEIGIGLNAGPLTVGVIGDGKRSDTGVVGDAVNCAARMEGLTKTYGARIVLSENANNGIGEGHQIRFLDRVRVKGKHEPLGVYEVFDADEPQLCRAKLATRERFAEGQRQFYAEQFADAIKCFSDVLKVLPGDRATQLYLQRSARFLLEGVPADWRVAGTLVAPS